MAPTRERYNFWIDLEDRAGLRLVKTRDGIPEAEQIRRAIRAWLESKGVTAKTAASQRRRARR